MYQYNKVSLLLTDKIHSKLREETNYLESKAVSSFSWHSLLFPTEHGS